MVREFDYTDLSEAEQSGWITAADGSCVAYSHMGSGRFNMFATEPNSPKAEVWRKDAGLGALHGTTALERGVHIFVDGDIGLQPEMPCVLLRAPFAISTHGAGSFCSGIEPEDMDGGSFQAISFIGGCIEGLVPRSAYLEDELMRSRIFGSEPLHISVADDAISAIEVSRRNTKRYAGETLAAIRIVFREKQPIERAAECVRTMVGVLGFLACTQSVRLLKVQTELPRGEVVPGSDPQWEPMASIMCGATWEGPEEGLSYAADTHVFNIPGVGMYLWDLYRMTRDDELGGCGQNMSVLPADRGKVFSLDNGLVRNVCTALEYEYAQLGWDMPKDEALAGVRAELHECAKQYFKDNECPGLTQSDKSKVFSTIGRIDTSAVEQYQRLHDSHADAVSFPIDQFVQYRLRQPVEPSMKALVKHRNEITHNAYLALNDEVAVSTLAARLVVYACVLARAGMNEDEIEAVFGRWV